MSSTKAVLCGYYGMGNAGDEALLVSLLQMLPESVTPIVLSGDPQATKKQYGVPSCDRKSAFTVLNALKQSQLFVWGGGSLMQDSTSIASPIYYAGLMALAQQQGLKTIAWAQGIGPLNKSLTRWLTKQVLYGCEAISVRDTASARLLQEWNIDPVVAPDPVWAMASKPTKELSDISQPIVAINLRSHPLLSTKRLNVLIEAIQQFQAQTSTHILLVPFQPTWDRAIAESVFDQLEQDKSILSLTDPQELKGIFKQVKMAIGMRLHSLIMAAAEGCSCFALSYDPKVSYLMSATNMPGYELDSLPLTSDEIVEVWLEIFQVKSTLNSSQIKSTVENSLIHQEMLRKVIGS